MKKFDVIGIAVFLLLMLCYVGFLHLNKQAYRRWENRIDWASQVILRDQCMAVPGCDPDKWWPKYEACREIPAYVKHWLSHNGTPTDESIPPFYRPRRGARP